MFVLLLLAATAVEGYPTVDISSCGSQCARLPSFLSEDCTKCLYTNDALSKFSFDEFFLRAKAAIAIGVGKATSYTYEACT